MSGPGPLSARRCPSRRSGVALIVTVIMLSVITFLAVAFLALTGREKGATKVATNQTTARLAADAALERAKLELTARILATTNLAGFNMLVSTNYYNANGFTNNSGDPLNVNYDYVNTGGFLNGGQTLQNLANLFYNPRPPVYITNRLGASNEFRYYLDLNRNFRHDVTGLWPVRSGDPGNPYFDTNGLRIPNIIFGNTLSNFFTGDPEWIGGLERLDLPHSSSNKFTHRYAYFVAPAGRTLDVNYIHNQALAAAGGTMNANGADYIRNEGVGSWEINLAALLFDLNTNAVYGWGPASVYDPLSLNYPGTAFQPGANAFADAGALYHYRLNGSPTLLGYSLPSVNFMYGATPFGTDFVDGYSDGPLLIAPFTGLTVDNDNQSLPWVGAAHLFHFFTTQDLLDPRKTVSGGGYNFVNRLQFAGTNISSYDQYTFYRMQEQLGTDSAPEDPDKLNLNYVNVGGFSATNFVRWTDPGIPGSILFFTNAVDRLLRAYTTEWLAADYGVYTNIFKVDQPFGVTNIPVFIRGQLIYPSAVQRVLQMAANIWETKTNRADALGPLPTVFQPLFSVVNSNIYISGFREVSRAADLQAVPRPILDLTASTNLPTVFADDLIFGVPLVIGARKGLPNFNEFSMESTFVLTRKLELRKSSLGGGDRINQTNQFFTLSVTMPIATEFWNSYASNYTRPVSIYVTNRTTMRLTNDLGVDTVNTFVTGAQVNSNTWPQYWAKAKDVTKAAKSFVTPLRTNIPFLPLVGYVPLVGFVSATNELLFDTSQGLLAPKWGLAITNRVHAMILDTATGKIIDYVLLGDLTSYRDLTAEFSNPATGTGDAFDQLWATNTLSSGRLSGRLGIMQQINISRGSGGTVPLPNDRWKKFGTFTPSSEVSAAAFFDGFFQDTSTNLHATAPFSPSIQFAMPMSWQANDPLVHYIASELFDIARSGPINLKKIDPPGFVVNTNTLVNIGELNKRYIPWPSPADVADPTDQDALDAINPSLKDPLIRTSDDWQFPTNALPTVGWLGRIHRGTPWQTIYLKASNVGLTNIVASPTEWADPNKGYKPAAEKWSKWTGNKTLEEGYYTRPVTDRVLFDVFTTAVNDNAARGRLPINQSGLAAWSALFSGIVALTNSTVNSPIAKPNFLPQIIQPAGIYDAFDTNNWPPLVRMVDSINRTRANTNYFRNGTFEHVGDILAVPELTDASPFLNVTNNTYPMIRGMTDAAYEWLPQQMLSLVQLGEPRFVVYAYGQSLQPASDSILTSGNFFGMCTNYTITAEVAARAVVRIEGSPNPAHTNIFLPPKKRYPPRIVVESYNFLPPE